MNENDIVQPILVPNYPGLSETWAMYTAIRTCIGSYMNREHDGTQYWEQWLTGRFTKSVRRYDVNKMNEYVQLPHAKVAMGICSDGERKGSKLAIITLPPTTYADMPKLVRKCQVKDTEFHRNNGEFWPTLKDWEQNRTSRFGGAHKWGLHLNAQLYMSSGKAIAQLCHAALAAWILYEEKEYQKSGMATIDLIKNNNFFITSNPAIFDLIQTDFVIQDAGFTEVEPGSVTVKISSPVSYERK